MAGTIAEIMMHLQLEPVGILSGDEELLPAIHSLGLTVLNAQDEVERQDELIEKVRARAKAAATEKTEEDSGSGDDEPELEDLSGASEAEKEASSSGEGADDSSKDRTM